MDFNFMPQMQRSQAIKPYYNTGCALLDITTGRYVRGKFGEKILSGGVGLLNAVIGKPNLYKSTLAYFMNFSALSKFKYSRFGIYCTEMNTQEHRLNSIAQAIAEYHGRDLFQEGVFSLTDKSIMLADEWYEKKREQMQSKIDNLKKISVRTPFLDHDGVSLMTVPYITADMIDSFTEFESKDVAEIQRNNELGDSGANTIFMRQGVVKTRFRADSPRHANLSNNIITMTAHVGNVIGMDPRNPPPKKMTFMKQGEVVKGVSGKFLFLTSICWHMVSASILVNDSTRGADYPYTPDDVFKGDCDLVAINAQLIRNKNGQSGCYVQLIASQNEGILPYLSDFHYLRTEKYYGCDGNDRNYSLSLVPDVKLQRTTVRQKLRESPKLQRAVQISAEMLLAQRLHTDMPAELVCTPKELYDDLIAKGFDWNILLNTRGWWCYDNHLPHGGQHYLSTLDLLEIRAGIKDRPYWLAEDKRTIIDVKI